MKPMSYQNNQNKNDLLRQFYRQMMIPVLIIICTSILFSYEKFSKEKISNNLSTSLVQLIENNKQEITKNSQNQVELQVSCTAAAADDDDNNDNDINNGELKLKFNCRLT